MADRIQLRRDTKANWESYNPILLEGEPGHVLDDPNLYKMGDGIHTWNQLPYRGYSGTVSQSLGDAENAVVSQRVVTQEKNIQTISWSNKGLNNQRSDVVMDISSTAWLQSNYLDIRLLDKINFSKAGCYIYLIAFDSTINPYNSVIESGHWATVAAGSSTISDIQEKLSSLSFKPAFFRVWINNNGQQILPSEITADDFSLEYLTNEIKYKYVENIKLDNLIKELYITGVNRGAVTLGRIKKQGGTGDDRGLILGEVNGVLYNIIAIAAPRVADKSNNIIKAVAGAATMYFLIDWDALSPGQEINLGKYFKTTDNAYTLCSNPQISEYLSSNFYLTNPIDSINGKYIFMNNGNILDADNWNISVYPISSNRKYRIKGTLDGTTTFGVFSNYSNKELSGLVYLFNKSENASVSVDEIIQGYDGYLAVSWNRLNINVYTDDIPLNDVISNVNNLKNNLSTEVRKEIISSRQGFVNTGGTFVSHDSYSLDSYDVVEGETYRALGTYAGVSGVATVSLWKNDFFLKTISDTNIIVSPGTLIDVDVYFTIPVGLGVNKVCITNTYGETLFLYKVDVVNIVNINKTIEDVSSLAVIADSVVTPTEVIDSTYLSKDGALKENSSYVSRKYAVQEGQKFKVRGSVRGTSVVAAFALYSGEVGRSNLYSIYRIIDFVGHDYSGAVQAVIDKYVTIPSGVNFIVTCSVPADNNDMLLYNAKNTKDYLRENYNLKYVDCLGDSLTMNANRFGYFETTLQQLLGNDYVVRNWGVGGEGSGSIMARQGSDCIKFQEDWTLKADGSNTLVMNTEDNNLIIRTQKYNTGVALLLQGAENDPGQKERVVNPCYINGIECTMSYVQDSAYGKGRWYMKRNAVGDRDIVIPANTPVYFNTGKEMAKANITIVWMGTNDGVYADWQTLVDKQVMVSNKISNKRFIIIGLHKLNKVNGETYEALMRNTFGNKFFNIREYMSTNMIYDAGITPTASDLEQMAAGLCPSSLLYDSTHLNPSANEALGKMLYKLCVSLGYC